MGNRSIFAAILAVTMLVLSACQIVNRPPGPGETGYQPPQQQSIQQNPNTVPQASQNATSGPSTTSAQPAPPASTAPQPTAIVRGSVMDSAGNRLDGATVTVRVTDGSVRFADGTNSATATTVNGTYVINGVPTGAVVEVTATKDGFNTRRQTVVPVASRTADTSTTDVNFDPSSGQAL